MTSPSQPPVHGATRWGPLGIVARTALIFLPAATLGTVGHELGHWGAAWALGCAPELHYASVSPHCPPAVVARGDWLGVAAGPASTVLCACAGVLGLHRWRRRADHLDYAGMLWTVLALFWTRPLFNTLVQLGAIALGLLPPEVVHHSDEGQLSVAMGWPPMALSVSSSIVAVGVIAWTTQRVPAAERGPWAAGALSGALVGFAVWMGGLGPVWLP